jgi:uncharacterized protein YjbJ (UPF0337 family)
VQGLPGEYILLYTPMARALIVHALTSLAYRVQFIQVAKSYWPISYKEETFMNWDQIEGNWKQLQGRAKQQWGNLTDDDLTQIDGKREVLIGKLQQRYGIVREQAMKKVDEWLKVLDKQPATTQQESHQTAKG